MTDTRRILVMFDLPVKTRTKRRNAARFRRFLLKDGYDMLQFSVYVRIVSGPDAAEKHFRRLHANLPPEGSVRCLQLSERQFSAMHLMLGSHTRQEQKVGKNRMLLF